jgi:hypothetical protein
MPQADSLLLHLEKFFATVIMNTGDLNLGNTRASA